MRGSSRGAAAAGLSALHDVLGGGNDGAALAEDLFASAVAIDGNATLRRALADPSREGSAKRGLLTRLFQGRVSAGAEQVLGTVVAERWAAERDLTDTIEMLGVEAVLAGAEEGGRLDDLEDELFRFERIVAGDPELRDALTNRQADPQRKAELVRTLLEGKASAETIRLARQAVLAPRGRRLDRTIAEYLQLAADRRQRQTAVVTSAIPLDESQRSRLAAALQSIYGKQVLIQAVVDPEVVGGIRVRIGDEVIDGTVLRRLDLARRHLTR